METLQENIKRNTVMSRSIASILLPKILKTTDLSNAVFINNQFLYNNLTSVVETNSSEKEITNAEEQQESGSNDSQSETFQSSTTPDVKKSNESKLVSYEIIFLIFICPLLRMSGFVKYVFHFLMETQVIELL